MPRDHAPSEMGTWKSVIIRIIAGSSLHEITHRLRRGHGKVVMIGISRKLMPRDHALPVKGTWQSGHGQGHSRKLMPQDHPLPVKGTWQSGHD